MIVLHSTERERIKMKIHVNVDVTLDVSEKEGKELLSEENKSALLMTLYCGNNDDRPDLGKWYVDGKYAIENKYFGKVE